MRTLLLLFYLFSNTVFCAPSLLSVMPRWSQNTVFGLNFITYAQIFAILIILTIGIGIRFAVQLVVKKRLAALFSRLNLTQVEKILKKATTPLGNLAMVGFFSLFLNGLDLPLSLTDTLKIALRIFAALSAVLLAYRSVDVISSYTIQKTSETGSKLDSQIVPLFFRAIKIAVVIIGGLFVLQNLNVDVSSLLGGMAIGGLAFSFAAKDTVANIFGSFTIFADSSFKVGDWIKVAGVEGTVVSVGFRSTRVRTFYNSIMTIPNSKFTDSIVDNMSLREFRRVSTNLGLTYDSTPDEIEAFCNGVRAILQAHPLVRQDNYQAHFVEYGDSSLNITLRFHIKAENFSEELRTKHEIFLDIMRLAKSMNLSFAFPTQTLHVETLAQAEKISPRATDSKDNLQKLADDFSKTGKMHLEPGPRLGESYYSGS